MSGTRSSAENGLQSFLVPKIDAGYQNRLKSISQRRAFGDLSRNVKAIPQLEKPQSKYDTDRFIPSNIHGDPMTRYNIIGQVRDRRASTDRSKNTGGSAYDNLLLARFLDEPDRLGQSASAVSQSVLQVTEAASTPTRSPRQFASGFPSLTFQWTDAVPLETSPSCPEKKSLDLSIFITPQKLDTSVADIVNEQNAPETKTSQHAAIGAKETISSFTLNAKDHETLSVAPVIPRESDSQPSPLSDLNHSMLSISTAPRSATKRSLKIRETINRPRVDPLYSPFSPVKIKHRKQSDGGSSSLQPQLR